MQFLSPVRQAPSPLTPDADGRRRAFLFLGPGAEASSVLQSASRAALLSTALVSRRCNWPADGPVGPLRSPSGTHLRTTAPTWDGGSPPASQNQISSPSTAPVDQPSLPAGRFVFHVRPSQLRVPNQDGPAQLSPPVCLVLSISLSRLRRPDQHSGMRGVVVGGGRVASHPLCLPNRPAPIYLIRLGYMNMCRLSYPASQALLCLLLSTYSFAAGLFPFAFSSLAVLSAALLTVVFFLSRSLVC